MVELELHSHCGEAASESLASICTFGHILESPSHSHLAEGQACGVLTDIEFCIRYHGVHDVILMSCIFLVLCACEIEPVCPHVLSVHISVLVS